MAPRQTRRQLALLIGVATLFSVAASGTPAAAKIVHGFGGISSEIVWSVEHRRADRRSWETARTKIGLAVDSRQNVYLLDKITTGMLRRRGLWLRKYRPDGTVAWTIKQLPPPGQRVLPQSLAVDNQDNVWVLATARLKRSEVLIQKISPAGRRLWTRSRPMQPYPGMGPGFMTAVDSSGVYIAGTVRKDDLQQPWLAKYKLNGDLVWERFPLDYENRSRTANRTWGALKGMGLTGGLIRLAADTYQKPAPGTYWGSGWMGTGYDRDGNQRPVPGNGFTRLEEEFMSSPLATEGPGGYAYSIVEGPLDIWLEVGGRNLRRKARPVSLRTAIFRAREGYGDLSLTAKRLVVDKHGNAYAAAYGGTLGHPLVRLYKVKITLPKQSADLTKI